VALFFCVRAISASISFIFSITPMVTVYFVSIFLLLVGCLVG